MSRRTQAPVTCLLMTDHWDSSFLQSLMFHFLLSLLVTLVVVPRVNLVLAAPPGVTGAPGVVVSLEAAISLVVAVTCLIVISSWKMIGVLGKIFLEKPLESAYIKLSDTWLLGWGIKIETPRKERIQSSWWNFLGNVIRYNNNYLHSARQGRQRYGSKLKGSLITFVTQWVCLKPGVYYLGARGWNTGPTSYEQGRGNTSMTLNRKYTFNKQSFQSQGCSEEEGRLSCHTVTHNTGRRNAFSF